MEKLSSKERELVEFGAALGSNYVPCIEYHIPEARKAGLSDQQIVEAIRFADKVHQFPFGKYSIQPWAWYMKLMFQSIPNRLGPSAPSLYQRPKWSNLAAPDMSASYIVPGRTTSQPGTNLFQEIMMDCHQPPNFD